MKRPSRRARDKELSPPTVEADHPKKPTIKFSKANLLQRPTPDPQQAAYVDLVGFVQDPTANCFR